MWDEPRRPALPPLGGGRERVWRKRRKKNERGSGGHTCQKVKDQYL